MKNTKRFTYLYTPQTCSYMISGFFFCFFLYELNITYFLSDEISLSDTDRQTFKTEAYLKFLSLPFYIVLVFFKKGKSF